MFFVQGDKNNMLNSAVQAALPDLGPMPLFLSTSNWIPPPTIFPCCLCTFTCLLFPVVFQNTHVFVFTHLTFRNHSVHINR
jgi:hypothetical protein